METPKPTLFLVYSLNIINDDALSIHPGKKLYFSQLEKAEDFILRFSENFSFLYDENQDEHVYCLVMDEFEMDSTYRNQLSTRVYSPEGQLISSCMVPDDGPFLGRPKMHMHHEVGDVVEFPYGNQLVFGIVVSQPMCFNEHAGEYGLTASDDCYALLHQRSPEIDYAHAPLVFKPTHEISDEVKMDLQTAFRALDMKS